MKHCVFLAVTLLMLITSCNSVSKNQKKNDFEKLYTMMIGEFSSEEQSKKDSTFFNINLVMYPIWENQTESKWLYVEQAVTKYIDRPYRQRVYELIKNENGVFESKVYELSNPKKFIHGWKTPEIFKSITPDSLKTRVGCTVYLEKKSDNIYSGQTKKGECLSSLRGATYATSIVSIYENKIVSWDQGWNDKDEQVWGAVKEGYIFKRK